MALKSDRDRLPDSASIEERLDVLEKLIERTKVMYEQYFLGIQKIAPMQLHRDAERGIRELTQINIRNTALRFRFNTLTQKYGSYNTYWRRIMREIEQGRYIRDISRVGRQAVRRGEEIPEEILAAMPKRMREKIKRDRAKMAERAARARAESESDEPAIIRDRPRSNVHKVSGDDMAFLDDDANLDEMFASMIDEAAETIPKAKAVPATPQPKPQPKPEPPAATRAPPAAARAPAAKRAAPAARAPAAKPVRPSPPPARKSAPLPGGVSEREARALYERYVQAKKLVGDSVEKITYDKIVKTISKQAPRIMKQYGAKGVEFNVVLKDDKVILKAKPKK